MTTAHPTLTTQTIEILQAARERIALPGAWYQRTFYGPNGSACLVGTVNIVVRSLDAGGPDVCKALAIALDTLAHIVPYQSLSTWNDAKGRTQAEVVALFDEAIASLLPQVGLA